MSTRETGNSWEEFAVSYLKKKNYTILFRNWTCRWGEIDIVALEPARSSLVFVEVKFRDGKFGYAYEAVNFHKIRALRRAAKLFIQKERPKQQDFRFDLVALTKFPGRVEIRHFEAVDQQW